MKEGLPGPPYCLPLLRHIRNAKALAVYTSHEQGATHQLDVPEDETVLDAALAKGIDVPYDCKMGVCL